MDDIDLIKNVKKNGDSDSIQELINRHSGIYVKMVQKYIPKNDESFIYQDFIDDKDSCIYDAALNFDESKNTKFSTYIGNLTKWKCMNAYNKKNKNFKKIIDESREKNFSKDFDFSSIEEVENLENVLESIENIPDERAKVIFKMRYFKSNKITPWKKIAKKLDLSIQGCINIHNKYLMEIKNICHHTIKQ